MFSQVSSTVILCSWRTHPTSSIAKPSCMETIMKVHLKWFQLAEIWWGSSGMCWCASRDPIFFKAPKTAAPFLPWHRSNGITAKAESAAPLLLAIIEPRLVVVAADLILSSSPLLRPIVRLFMLLVLLFLVPRDAQCVAVAAADDVAENCRDKLRHWLVVRWCWGSCWWWGDEHDENDEDDKDDEGAVGFWNVNGLLTQKRHTLRSTDRNIGFGTCTCLTA